MESPLKFLIAAIPLLCYFSGPFLNPVVAQTQGYMEPYTEPPDRADVGDVCARNDHYTDPFFTCCGGKRVNASSIYTNPKNSCLNPSGNDKFVKSSWSVFKCLVKSELGDKPLTFENLGEILMKNLPDPAKPKIRKHLQNFTSMGYKPYESVTALGEFAEYANAWNAYYMAENWGCSEIGRKNQTVDFYDGASGECYNWIDQGTRRGDCCRGVPIPFQIVPEPMNMIYYALKNYTAYNIMRIVGKDYLWKNTTIVMYSDNVANCLRTADFLLRGFYKLDELEKNVTKMVPPNYRDIAEKIVPKFVSRTLREQIVTTVANESAAKEDWDIVKFTDTSTSIYKYIYANEWQSQHYNQDATRYLFWTCRAHKLMVTWYKDVDFSEMCY